MNEIRMKLLALLDKHGDSYLNCKGCSICTKIEQLRKKLDRDPVEKFRYILDKGRDMTRSELALLIDNDIRFKDIRKSLKMNNDTLNQTLKNLGLSRKKRKGVKEDMAKPLPITVDEFIQLFYVEKKSIKEICQMKGFKVSALYNWKWVRKEEIKKAAAEKGVTIPEPSARKEGKPLKKHQDENFEIKQQTEALQAALDSARYAVSHVDDVVNHPSHYYKNGIDVIKFSELQFDRSELKGFYRINVLKYVTRYDRKNKVEDLKKAEFYLKKLIDLEETNHDH